MSDRASRAAVERLLRRLDDGAQVQCDGQVQEYGATTGQPHVITIHDDRFWTAVACGGALGQPTPDSGWWAVPISPACACFFAICRRPMHWVKAAVCEDRWNALPS